MIAKQETTAYAAELEVELDLYFAYEPDLEVELDLYYAYEPDLEVEIQLLVEPPQLARVSPEDVARAAIDRRRAAQTIAPTAPGDLDDDWFGTFDETDPAFVAFESGPTSRLRRISDWLLRRAA